MALYNAILISRLGHEHVFCQTVTRTAFYPYKYPANGNHF